MKVYVDELPKKCLKCPCFNQCGYMCQINKKMLDTVGKGSADNSRDKDCPLQSLSAYTKQVRKEVCEQIKAEFDTSGFNKISASLYPPTDEAMWIGKGFNACKERLFNKLDQIQEDRGCE